MVVELIKESADYETYWVLNSSASWNGNSLYLFKNGGYKRCNWQNAETMTAAEAEAALRKLNKRLPRPATMDRFMPEWN